MQQSEMLSLVEMNNVGEIVNGLMVEELAKIRPNESIYLEVSSFFVDKNMSVQFHQLMLPRNLATLSTEIFTSVNIATFMLNYANRLAMLLSVKDISIDAIKNTCINGLAINHSLDAADASLCMIPKSTQNALYLDEKEMLGTLTANFWLVAFILLNVFFDVTVISTDTSK